MTIETTCTKGAETSNHVSLRFGDAKSNEVLVHHLNSKHAKRVDPLEPQVLDDVPRKPFQACMVDQFWVTGQCVESPICYLYLKLGGDDDWRPGFALVRIVDPQKSHLSSNNFYFRRYLPRRVWHGSDLCDPEITPFGLKYRRNVFAKNPPKLWNVTWFCLNYNSFILVHKFFNKSIYKFKNSNLNSMQMVMIEYLCWSKEGIMHMYMY